LNSNYPEAVPQPEPEKASRQRPAWLSFLWEVLQTLIMAVILYFLIDTVVGRVRVENISMQPTLHEGEFILVNKLAYRLGDFQRGDIVVFHHDPTEDYIKRVIGLPGDVVDVRDNHVFVNNRLLNESYIAAPPHYTGAWKVPPGQIFVLGDNRNQSSDSHQWGYVPEDTVVGRALVIYWPLQNLTVLNQVPTVAAANN
jgi:signal peptidase I